ncbi:hypothetical protein FN846DRAFT_691641 [Sphaerosporella brunnea]|uniref:Uncharacterized protein n=1 Tax=Sphaerosporella brunnea TaxID=1250544 RepID=A0A5J5EYC4_9PEZI|nr:hypothetical protein FN846DRAFT_691641 [Sphaerosporella brunnea]
MVSSIITIITIILTVVQIHYLELHQASRRTKTFFFFVSPQNFFSTYPRARDNGSNLPLLYRERHGPTIRRSCCLDQFREAQRYGRFVMDLCSATNPIVYCQPRPHYPVKLGEKCFDASWSAKRRREKSKRRQCDEDSGDKVETGKSERSGCRCGLHLPLCLRFY